MGEETKEETKDDETTAREGRGESIQVIARAAAILRALASQSEGSSLGRLARQVGLPRSTVQRIVGALRDEQWVTVEDGLRLGPGLAALAGAARGDVLSVAQPHLDALRQRVDETVNLTLLQGRRAVSVARSFSDRPLSVRGALGDTYPLHSTSHGKALLAQMTDEQVRRLMGSRLEPLTSRTLRTLPALLEDLRGVRERGVAVDEEEHAEGICAVGVALRLATGPRYALAIPIPASRFAARRDVLQRELLRCREELEATMAGVLPPPGP
ncbi:IclR family transcriptional regulator [Melittangium boletus]|uniref:IclR family transcriptional regulator n=1 Tax=Melittangium boletus TaxID=83453 RepID=UPI003DA66A40